MRQRYTSNLLHTVRSFDSEQAQVAELVALRQEIVQYNNEVFKLELAAFTGVAALFGWLFIAEPRESLVISNFGSYLSFLPSVISIIVLNRFMAYRHRSARLGLYLAHLEKRLGFHGWEQHLWTTRFGFNPFQEREELAKLVHSYPKRGFRGFFGTYPHWKAARNFGNEESGKPIYDFASKPVIDVFSSKMQSFWYGVSATWLMIFVTCASFGIFYSNWLAKCQSSAFSEVYCQTKWNTPHAS